MGKPLNNIGFAQAKFRRPEDLKFLAELALIHSIPSMASSSHIQGRLGSLYNQMIKIVEKIFNTRVIKATKEERAWLGAQIAKFGEVTGWESTPKHVATVLSFSCALVEREERFNPRLLEKLNLIIEYLEKGGELRVQNCWAGSLALEKWDKIFEKIPEV